MPKILKLNTTNHNQNIYTQNKVELTRLFTIEYYSDYLFFVYLLLLLLQIVQIL